MADALSQRPGGYTATISETTRFLNERLPGLVHDKTRIYESAEELLASPYARGRTFSEKELAGIRSAEGFFDPKTGDSIVIANNVNLNPGESPRQALSRVVLHERVGHDGMNYLLDQDHQFAQRWTDLTKSIPTDEIQAIARQPGYEHLQGRPHEQALEWFARKVESDPNILEKQPLMRQMWDTLKHHLSGLYVRAGLGDEKAFQQRSFEREVQTFITQSRQAALKPRPPTPAAQGRALP